MPVSPHSLIGFKTRALVESFFNPLDDKGNEELDKLVNDLLRAIDIENNDNSVKELFYTKDVGDIKNYFIAVTEKSVDENMLKMYQEYLLQRKKKDLPVSIISFAKVMTLYTIINKLSQDKKYSLTELLDIVNRITESEQ